MKLTVKATDLARTLNVATKLCPSRPVHPMAAAVLLRADSTLRVRATDYERYADVAVAAHVAAPGTAAVSGRLLAEIAKHCRGDVEFTVDGPLMRVRVQGGSWGLPTLPAEDFPGWPAVGEPWGTVNGPNLAVALGRVAPVAGGDKESGKGLAGVTLHAVHLHVGEFLVHLEATDRYQAAFCDLDWSPDPNRDVRGEHLYVPSEAAPHLADIAKAAAEVTIAARDGLLSITSADHAFSCRLSDVPTPNMSSFDLAADAYPVEIRVDAKRLREALSAVRLVMDQYAPAKLTITPDGLTVEAAYVEATDAGQEMPVLHHRGDPLVIGLTPARLDQAIALCGTPQVTIACQTPTRPVLVRPVSDGEPVNTYRHLVMPQRLDRPSPVVQR